MCSTPFSAIINPRNRLVVGIAQNTTTFTTKRGKVVPCYAVFCLLCMEWQNPGTGINSAYFGTTWHREEFVSLVKVLFICHGNICRSTMAEFVMKELVRRHHFEEAYEIASAATSREEIGNDTHWGTKEQLDLHHIPYVPRKARQMTRADYGYYDLLIGFDDENLREIRRIAGGDPDRKIHLLLDFTDHPREIADPWYTGDFVSTYRDVVEGCESLFCRKNVPSAAG